MNNAVASLGSDHWHEQVTDDGIILEDLGLSSLDLSFLVENLLFDLVNFVVDGHKGLFGGLELILGFSFGGVVLFAPEGEFLVHGIHIVVYELYAFA